jgi:NAD-dependent DNA ligase
MDQTVKVKIKIKVPKKTRKNQNDLKLSGVTKSMAQPRLNERYVELMETLGYVMRVRKDAMRARAYANAKETIAGFSGDITSPEQLKDKKGIGTTIYQKLVDYTATGTLRVLEESKDIIAKKKAIDVFANIYGVGEKSAEELVDKGITTMEELELRKTELLNDKQLIGLKYYNDILQRIPRSEIKEYEKIFKSAFPKNVECSRFEIVGSYRRGMKSSGDIDVIITSSHSNVFKVFIDELLSRQIIVEVLSRGNSKCLVVAKLPGAQYARRVDFLYTTPEEYPFSVLYFTGSKEFNTVMREHALSMKYTLNEHGLSVMENRKKGDRVEHVFVDEQAIFDFLNLEYKKPTERVDGSAVKVKGAVPVEEPKRKSKSVEEPKPKSKSVEEPKPKSLPVEEPKPKPKSVPTVKSRSPSPTTETKKNKVVIKRRTTKKNQNYIELFKKDGIQVLDPLTEAQLNKMIQDANNAYYTVGTPLMTDNEYDILYEYITNKFKKPEGIGAPVEKNKVTLPYEMASMDKIKPDTGALTSWKSKYNGPYVLSCKLDGVSGMYSTEGEVPKLYTRGDGKVGQDISHLIPKLRLPKEKGVVIRGEFVIPKQVFATKYAAEFANPRNLVAGIVNRKTVDDKINDIRFVAYEVIKPDGLTPSAQMAKLASLDVDVVQNEIIGNITNESLSQVLQDWRKYYMFEIDGVIVADDNVHPRATGNPDHSFAFKMVLSDQVAEAHVVDVLWSASKDGYLKPRVQIMPLKLGGVTIQFATGFNGSYIEENKIGVGAIIQIVRSGDVIPKIMAVTTPAETAKMPDVDYIWNDTHVDVMLADASGNATVLEKNITGFFKGIEVDGLGPKNVEKMIAAGHDSVPKILRMTKEDFLKVEGFQEKTAQKLLDGIRVAVDKMSLATLMAFSNKLGRGFSTKRAEMILAEYPNVLNESEPSIAKLVAINGIEKKTAQSFVDHIPEFLEFVKECGLESKLMMASSPAPKRDVDTSHALYDKTVVFTGFRDKELEDKLKGVGAKLGSSVSGKTFVVVAKESSGKTEEAKKRNIPVLTPEEFVSQYFPSIKTKSKSK